MKLIHQDKINIPVIHSYLVTNYMCTAGNYEGKLRKNTVVKVSSISGGDSHTLRLVGDIKADKVSGVYMLDDSQNAARFRLAYKNEIKLFDAKDIYV